MHPSGGILHHRNGAFAAPLDESCRKARVYCILADHPANNFSGGAIMKAKWAAVLIGAVLATATLVYAQDASTTDANKSSGAGSTIKKDTKTAAKDTEKGVKTAGKDTGKAVKTGAKDTEKGAKVVGKDTEKAADKTGSAMKKGVKKLGGKDDKPADDKTADQKPASSPN
jgi:hypothetical protein